MAIDLNAIRNRLNSLQTKVTKTDNLWKPTPGKQQVRILPYIHRPNNPFIELYFHFDFGGKNIISPISFGEADPIVEFAEKLKATGNREDWNLAKQLTPKMRTYVPILVRGEESEGVKFWGFGKTVYQDILGYIADPDYGDITDPITGRDIVLEVQSAEESNAAYPTTTIRVRPSQTKLADDAEMVKQLLENQKEITELYQELSYAELKTILENWLNPSAGGEADDDIVEELEAPKPKAVTPLAKSNPETVPMNDLPWEKEEKPKVKDDVATAFDDLFNN